MLILIIGELSYLLIFLLVLIRTHWPQLFLHLIASGLTHCVPNAHFKKSIFILLL